MGRPGLSSRATRIAKLAGQGSDGHLKSLQSSASRTAWLSCHCQRLLLWICQQYRGRRRPVLRWDGYQTPCLTSSVAQARHWRFLGEDHPPERPEHRLGAGSPSASGKCLKMTGRLCELCSYALFRGSWTQLHPRIRCKPWSYQT